MRSLKLVTVLGLMWGAAFVAPASTEAAERARPGSRVYSASRGRAYAYGYRSPRVYGRGYAYGYGPRLAYGYRRPYYGYAYGYDPYYYDPYYAAPPVYARPYYAPRVGVGVVVGRPRVGLYLGW